MAEQPPSVCRMVFVHLPGPDRVDTYAAVVTGVRGDGFTVDATLFPPGGDPMPLLRVPYAAPSAERGAHWTWPPRL